MTPSGPSQILAVARGRHRIHAEVTPGDGPPLVLMHGFPDSLHLYDRVMPHLAGHRPVVRFDFLGWGCSDKPEGYPYTATNQVGDVEAVIESASAHVDTNRVVLVAHDASGPPAIDWALDHSERVERMVLLNTYYHWNLHLRRPPAPSPASRSPYRSGAPGGGRHSWPRRSIGSGTPMRRPASTRRLTVLGEKHASCTSGWAILPPRTRSRSCSPDDHRPGWPCSSNTADPRRPPPCQ
jgi:pimeloyl-ACP methyl ester carboxylesterase